MSLKSRAEDITRNGVSSYLTSQQLAIIRGEHLSHDALTPFRLISLESRMSLEEFRLLSQDHSKFAGISGDVLLMDKEGIFGITLDDLLPFSSVSLADKLAILHTPETKFLNLLADRTMNVPTFGGFIARAMAFEDHDKFGDKGYQEMFS